MSEKSVSEKPGAPREALAMRAVPLVFALLWSTGWISAGAAAPHADPLTFLTVRFALAALALGMMIAVMGAPWPARGRDVAHIMVAGLMVHAIYLGAVWWAVAKGVPAGISGVIAAVQPILTAMLAPVLLGERLTRGQIAGIGVGFLGIVLVLQPKLAATQAGRLGGIATALFVNLIGMLAVTLGTIYQKRFVPGGDLRIVAFLQYVASALFMLPLAWLIEPMRMDWNGTLIATMAWAVLALSIGGVAAYFWLIRRGAVSKAASLIYLVPPAAVVQAWLLFGETLVPLQMLGMVVTVAGVVLAVRR
jgi:drug/metabolite transporter (DMT)-like permease